MNLYTELRDLRLRMDDNPDQISPNLSDSVLTICLNNARRRMSKDYKMYDKQFFIFPIPHVDEYAIPNDYLELTSVLDVWKMQQFPPVHIGNAEITKTLILDNEVSIYWNFFNVNERRKTITFKNIPTYWEPRYTISTFSRENNYIIVNGTINETGMGTLKASGTTVTLTGGYTAGLVAGMIVNANGYNKTIVTIVDNSHFTVSDGTHWTASDYTWTYNPWTTSGILYWQRVKGYIKLVETDKNGTVYTEYARVSDIYNNGDNTYTLWISSWDLQNVYKDKLQLTGTLTSDTGTDVLVGIGSLFTLECSVGDNIYYDNTLIGVVDTVNSDTSITLVDFGASSLTNITMAVDNKYKYTSDGTIQFASYVCNYYSISKDLAYNYEEDRIPEDLHDLIALLASQEAWMRRSRIDMANQATNEYTAMRQKIRDSICEESSRIYNMGIMY